MLAGQIAGFHVARLRPKNWARDFRKCVWDSNQRPAGSAFRRRNIRRMQIRRLRARGTSPIALDRSHECAPPFAATFLVCGEQPPQATQSMEASIADQDHNPCFPEDSRKEP